MEITKDNFLEKYPEIERAIKEADFIAIDAEFTGLGPDLPPKCQYDTVAERYIRIRKGLHGFIIIQYGLCCFKWNEDKKRYEAKTFNIYIFPRPYKKFAGDGKFHCQSSCMEFLASQGFDFNKVFYKGLSYMSEASELSARNYLNKFLWKGDDTKDSKTASSDKKTSKNNSSSNSTTVPEKFKDFVESTCETVKNFLDTEKDGACLDLPSCTTFKRKLIFEAVQKRHPSGVHLESAIGEKGDKIIKVRKVSEEKREELEKEKNNTEMTNLDLAVGFSKVARLLAKSAKPLIGHNMLLDVMLTVTQFFTSLPEDLDEFKSLVQTLFPRIIDTKLMANTQPLKDQILNSRLDNLTQRMKSEPFEEPNVAFAEGFTEYDENTSAFHEAGYDAYSTGYSFIGLSNYLEKLKNPTEEVKAINIDAAILKPFVNRINLMRIPDIPYIDFAGPDIVPDWKHVFHAKFPSGWNYNDILDLFSPYGFVFVSWIDSTSAFVALERSKMKERVIKNLVAKREGPYRIRTYAQHIGLESEDKYVAQQQQQQEERGPRKKRSASASTIHPPETKEPPKKKEKSLDSDTEEGELSDSSDGSDADVNKSQLKDSKENNIKEKMDIAKTDDKLFTESNEW